MRCACVVDAANKRPDPSTRTAFNLKIQKTFHTFHTDTPDLCLSERQREREGKGDGGLWGVKQIRRKRKMRTRILTRHRGTHAPHQPIFILSIHTPLCLLTPVLSLVIWVRVQRMAGTFSFSEPFFELLIQFLTAI